MAKQPEDSREDDLFAEGVEPISTCLADVESKELKWLWSNRIPMGKLTLIAGYPGVGKSLLTVYMAAVVTTGGAWPDTPDESTEKGSVILLTAEDDLSDTVKPRMDAAGVDPSKVTVMEGVKLTVEGGEDQQFFKLTGKNHLLGLYKLIESLSDVRLIIIDPITAYVGKIDSHRNADVRGVLQPLCKLAEEVGAAVVCIIHPNKSSSLKAIHRATGSAAFVEAARAFWLVVEDKNDKDRKQLVPSKTNLSDNPTAMAYRIVDVPGDGDKLTSYACEFEPEPFYMTADEALSGDSADKRTRKPSPKLDRAVGWLKKTLKDGPIPEKKIERMAEENDISKSTLKNAKKSAGARSDKEGVGKDGRWLWRLPTKEEDIQDRLRALQPLWEAARPRRRYQPGPSQSRQSS